METKHIIQVLEAANQGSPQILHAAGRVFGLGDAERDALAKRSFPAWAVGLLGISVGILAGAAIQRRWPGKILPGG